LETAIRRLVSALIALGTLASIPVAVASAAPARPHVDVIEVNGLVDPVMADFLVKAVHSAETGGAVALVVQMDSKGGVLSGTRLRALVTTVSGSSVPVGAWVGGSGRPRAYGQAYSLFVAAEVKGVGPGAKVGPNRPLPAGTVRAPTLGDFIVNSGLPVPTKVVRVKGRPPQRRPDIDVRFAKPALVARLLHAVVSPSVPYVLLVVGLLLIVFEFFTAGVGIAGGAGLASVTLAAYGLGVLPTHLWAVLLLVLGVGGYAIDLQAGAPRFWTAVGTIALAVGSVRLYDGFSVPWIAMAVVIAGTALFMVAGMPVMIRTRFSTPTIGRESMVGELGLAVTDVAPEGTIELRGGPWRARTNRATPIHLGDSVRVVAIDGLLLEVEPETGGAKDAGH
jgi:membrane-bound serine protease (ClpP class)